MVSQAAIARYFGSEGDVHTPGKVSANDAVAVLVAVAFPRRVGRRQGCPVRASRTPGEDVVAVFAHGVDGAGDVETVLGGVPTVAVARWLTDAGRIVSPAGGRRVASISGPAGRSPGRSPGRCPARTGRPNPGVRRGSHERSDRRGRDRHPADRRGRGAAGWCGDRVARGDGGDRPLPRRARGARLRRGRGHGGVVRGGPPGDPPHRRDRRRGARAAGCRGAAVSQQRLALPRMAGDRGGRLARRLADRVPRPRAAARRRATPATGAVHQPVVRWREGGQGRAGRGGRQARDQDGGAAQGRRSQAARARSRRRGRGRGRRGGWGRHPGDRGHRGR